MTTPRLGGNPLLRSLSSVSRCRSSRRADVPIRCCVTPDYSIIIPAYNEEQLLPDTLSSVRRAMAALPERSGEIVVTDNDSTDDTPEIARAAGAEVVFEEHRQIARARNTGGQFSRGRYLIFVDADTGITPELLAKTLTALDSGKICGGGTVVRFDRRRSRVIDFLLWVWVFFSLRKNCRIVRNFNPDNSWNIRVKTLSSNIYPFYSLPARCLLNALAEFGG